MVANRANEAVGVTLEAERPLYPIRFLRIYSSTVKSGGGAAALRPGISPGGGAAASNKEVCYGLYSDFGATSRLGSDCMLMM
jgi:hypothetical protein